MGFIMLLEVSEERRWRGKIEKCGETQLRKKYYHLGINRKGRFEKKLK